MSVVTYVAWLNLIYDQKKIGPLFFSINFHYYQIICNFIFFPKLKCIIKIALANFITLLIRITVERACKAGWSMLE